jgi:hypothetical protein
MHEDFLKLPNLFSKEITDVKTLIERVRIFLLGNSSLVAEFKELIGWDDRQANPEKSVWTAPLEASYLMPPDGGGAPIADYIPSSMSCLSHLDLAKHSENSFYSNR